MRSLEAEGRSLILCFFLGINTDSRINKVSRLRSPHSFEIVSLEASFSNGRKFQYKSNLYKGEQNSNPKANKIRPSTARILHLMHYS